MRSEFGRCYSRWPNQLRADYVNGLRSWLRFFASVAAGCGACLETPFYRLDKTAIPCVLSDSKRGSAVTSVKSKIFAEAAMK